MNKFNEQVKKEIANRTIPLKKKGRGRPAKIVADARLKYVVDLILDGSTYRQIVDKCMVEFGVCESSVNA